MASTVCMEENISETIVKVYCRGAPLCATVMRRKKGRRVAERIEVTEMRRVMLLSIRRKRLLKELAAVKECL